MKYSARTALVACILSVALTSITASASSGSTADPLTLSEKGDVVIEPEWQTVELEDLTLDVVGLGLTVSSPESGTRATSRVEWSVSPGAIGKADTAYSLEKDEIVTINCTYSPRSADIDFGLITPDGTFQFVSGSNGNIQTAFRVAETGKYYFAVSNNSDSKVEVLGYVYY